MSKYKISAERFLELKRLRSFAPRKSGVKIVLNVMKGKYYSTIKYRDDDFVSRYQDADILDHLDDVELYAIINEPAFEEPEDKFLWLPRMYSIKKSYGSNGKFNAIKVHDGEFFITDGDLSYHRYMQRFYTEEEMIAFGFDLYSLKRSKNGKQWF